MAFVGRVLRTVGKYWSAVDDSGAQWQKCDELLDTVAIDNGWRICLGLTPA